MGLTIFFKNNVHFSFFGELLKQIQGEGSLGHPEVCRRPCIHFLRGCCLKAQTCAYCHVQQHDRMRNLDKLQREFFATLPVSWAFLRWLPFCVLAAKHCVFFSTSHRGSFLVHRQSWPKEVTFFFDVTTTPNHH